MTSILRVKKLTPYARIPIRGSKDAAGFDLISAYDYTVYPKSKQVCKTDIQIQCPSGSYARIAPKSGLARRKFIDVGAGVIDPDYRGNVCVILFNFSNDIFEVKRGDPIAQMIIERIYMPDVIECSSLDATERGNRGLGLVCEFKET